MLSKFDLTALLFLLLGIVCEVLGTVGGFGSSVFFVPMAQLFFDGTTVLGLTAVMHVFSNLSKIALFRGGIDWKLLLWIGLPGWVLVALGAWLVARVPFAYSNLLLGSFLIVFSILLLLRPRLKMPATWVAASTCGGLAGFWAGFTGTGGAIRGLGMAAFDLPKSVFVATSAAIDLGVDGIRAAIYLNDGFLQRENYWYIPLLLIISVLGTWLGKKVLHRMSQASFRVGVLVLLLIEGLWLLVHFLFVQFSKT
jgi:uncharacterized protein